MRGASSLEKIIGFFDELRELDQILANANRQEDGSMNPLWKTGPVGTNQRAVCAPNGEVRAVAENTVTASVMVRALNEYERGREQTQRLVALRDAVDRALTLIPEDIGTNVMLTEHLVEAREILAQAARESGGQGGERPGGMVRVTVNPIGIGGLLAARQAIQAKPGAGVQYPLTSFPASIEVDWA